MDLLRCNLSFHWKLVHSQAYRLVESTMLMVFEALVPQSLLKCHQTNHSHRYLRNHSFLWNFFWLWCDFHNICNTIYIEVINDCVQKFPYVCTDMKRQFVCHFERTHHTPSAIHHVQLVVIVYLQIVQYDWNADADFQLNCDEQLVLSAFLHSNTFKLNSNFVICIDFEHFVSKNRASTPKLFC